MANITRRNEGSFSPETSGYDPFRVMRDLMNFEPMGAFFDRGFARGKDTFVPTFDVKETKDAYVFCADLPGVKDEDVDISLDGNRLTISGKREAKSSGGDERYFSYECSYGSFTRSFMLPDGVDANNVNADLDNGVLTISVPKGPEHQARKISLKSAAEKLKGAFSKESGKDVNVRKERDTRQ